MRGFVDFSAVAIVGFVMAVTLAGCGHDCGVDALIGSSDVADSAIDTEGSLDTVDAGWVDTPHHDAAFDTSSADLFDASFIDAIPDAAADVQTPDIDDASTADAGGDAVDTSVVDTTDIGTDGSADTGPVTCRNLTTPTSIYEIQSGAIPDGQLVLLADVIVTTPLDYGGYSFWLQEAEGGANSGIRVYIADSTGLAISPGDNATLCGRYTETNDESRVEIPGIDDLQLTGSGPAPVPEVVTAATVGGGATAEQWEGVLVQVNDVTVTTANMGFGEWEVDDALILNDVFFDMNDWPEPAVDTTYTSITGVMTYTFGRYKLAPRNSVDIVP